MQLERERLEQRLELTKLTVREAMDTRFLQLDVGTSVENAARMMVASGQDAAVIVGTGTRVMGVVCLANVLSTLQANRYVGAMEGRLSFAIPGVRVDLRAGRQRNAEF